MKKLQTNIRQAFQATGIPPAGHDVKVPEPPKPKGGKRNG
jgi:hypothetical protein